MSGKIEHDARESTSSDGVSLATIISGLILLIVGLLWLLDMADVLNVTWTLAGSFILILIGVVLIAAARTDSHGGMIFLGIVLSVIVLIGSLASVPSIQGGVGERTTAPDNVAELEDSYSWGAGSQEFDLRRMDIPEGVTRVEISMGVGDLRIRLPEDVAVSINWSVGLGNAEVLDRSQSGVSIDGTHEAPGFHDAERQLNIDVQLGMGALEVSQ